MHKPSTNEGEIEAVDEYKLVLRLATLPQRHDLVQCGRGVADRDVERYVGYTWGAILQVTRIKGESDASPKTLSNQVSWCSLHSW